MFLKPNIDYSSTSLEFLLENGAIESRNSWFYWIESVDKSIIQKDLDRAATASSLAVRTYIP